MMCHCPCHFTGCFLTAPGLSAELLNPAPNTADLVAAPPLPLRLPSPASLPTQVGLISVPRFFLGPHAPQLLLFCLKELSPLPTIPLPHPSAFRLFVVLSEKPLQLPQTRFACYMLSSHLFAFLLFAPLPCSPSRI